MKPQLIIPRLKQTHYLCMSLFAVMAYFPNTVFASCGKSNDITSHESVNVAEVDSNAFNTDKLEENVPYREPNMYKLAKAYQLITKPLAFKKNHRLQTKYLALQQRVEQELMDIDIALLPKHAEQEEYYSQEDALKHLFILAKASYLGEIIPKNDKNAVRYLKKIVSYYQEHHPQDPYLKLKFLMSLSIDVISADNPIRHQSDIEIRTQVSALFLKAGDLATQASLLVDEFYRSHNQKNRQAILSQLEVIANKGNIMAISGLANIYDELSSLEPEKYMDTNKKWQKKLALFKK